MDEHLIESGQLVIEKELNGFIAARREHAIPSKDLKPHEYLATECVDCDEDLEEFRLKKGRTRCVTCQEIFEKKNRR